MKELFNALKTDIPALSFFCVGAVFALFFLVLSFFYIAKEKKRRNAFDITITVINAIALCLGVILGLCVVFYAYPTGQISVSGEYTAAFDLFGFKFGVPGLGAVIKFITTAYGISLYAVVMFALLLFIIVHPLRILRKGAQDAFAGAETFSELDGGEITDREVSDEEPVTDEAADERDDTLLDELSEENLSVKIDEIVTRAKIDVSSSDDVSPYMIDENDVSDVLDLLSDEVASDDSISESDENVAAESNEEVTSEDIAEDPDNIDAETASDENVAESNERTVREEKAHHVSDYVIPVTVRTITRPKQAAEPPKQEPKSSAEKQTETTTRKTQPEPAKASTGKAQPELTKESATPTKGSTTHKTQPEPAKESTTRKAQSKPTKGSATPPREVEAKHVPALPVGRRYVVQNRRNVVNMFNDYLNTKDKEEKERLENSLNTIILK